MPLKAVPRGKTFVYLECGSPVCLQLYGPQMARDAHALGVTLRLVPQGSTPSSITSAWDLAATMSPAPAVVIGGGTPLSTVAPQIKELEAKKVPVMGFGTGAFNTATGTDFPGVDMDVNDTNYLESETRLAMDWIATDAKGAAENVLWVTIPDYRVFTYTKPAGEKELAAVCPKCSVTTVSADATDIGSGIPQDVVSAIQRNTNIKYVFFDFGDMVDGVPQALQAAGLSGKKLVTINGTVLNVQYIKSGEEAAEVDGSNFYGADLAMDAGMRLVEGQSLSQDRVGQPVEIVTEAGLNDGAVHVSHQYGVVDVVPTPNQQQQFDKLWGIPPQ